MYHVSSLVVLTVYQPSLSTCLLLGVVHTAGRKTAVHGKLVFCCHRHVEANGFLHVRQNGVLRYRDSKGSEYAVVSCLRCETAWASG
jgi:hypothetical protein